MAEPDQDLIMHLSRRGSGQALIAQSLMYNRLRTGGGHGFLIAGACKGIGCRRSGQCGIAAVGQMRGQALATT